MLIIDVAKICHEANRAYCESIGDYSQVCWAEAPEWQKNSACAGVRFHLEDPEASPSGSHDNWMRGKALDGWKYGAVKNESTKEHPCMVPYSQLPEEQRRKDHLFVAIVRAFEDMIQTD